MVKAGEPITKKQARFRTLENTFAYTYSNDVINKWLEDDELIWMVNGPDGRRPIYADSKEEAVEDYLSRFYRELEPVEE